MNDTFRVKAADALTLLLITALSFCYSVYYSNFAKLHIKIPFLDFPIFIGEIILAFCLFLLTIRLSSTRSKLTRWHYLTMVYLIFVLVKAFLGYAKWGPLAFRNAAMFYYPLFVVIGYYSFHISFLNNKYAKHLILSLVIITFFLLNPRDSFRFGYFVLMLMFSLQIQNKLLRRIALAFLIPAFTYRLLTLVSRGSLPSIAISALFFVTAYLIYFINFRLAYKMTIIIISLVFFSLFAWLVGDRGNIRALFALDNYIKSYNQISQKLSSVKEFEFKKMSRKLYGEGDIIQPTNFTKIPAVKEKSKTSYRPLEMLKLNEFLKSEPSKLHKTVVSGKQAEHEENTFYTALSNTLWRVFVWKDMLAEWLENGLIFGCDFGKPFQSRTVEIMRWSDGAWVGWLEPHNSYVHIIYRSGIIGFLLTILLWVVFVKTAKKFIILRSINGMFLSSILLYWLCIISFHVVLELPYLAIPFWALLGITLKYSHYLSTNK